jgi:hypothetical protein
MEYNIALQVEAILRGGLVDAVTRRLRELGCIPDDTVTCGFVQRQLARNKHDPGLTVLVVPRPGSSGKVHPALMMERICMRHEAYFLFYNTDLHQVTRIPLKDLLSYNDS